MISFKQPTLSRIQKLNPFKCGLHFHSEHLFTRRSSYFEPRVCTILCFPQTVSSYSPSVITVDKLHTAKRFANTGRQVLPFRFQWSCDRDRLSSSSCQPPHYGTGDHRCRKDENVSGCLHGHVIGLAEKSFPPIVCSPSAIGRVDPLLLLCAHM